MSAKQEETPLSLWAEYVYHLPGLLFYKDLFYYFLPIFIATLFVLMGSTHWAWFILVKLLVVLIVGFIVFELASRSRQDILFSDRELHFGSHTHLALGEVFHGNGPLTLQSYFHNFNTEEFADQILVNLSRGSVPNISFTGEKIREGIVLACVVNMQGEIYSLYPVNFLLTTAKLMQQTTEVELLPLSKNKHPFCRESQNNHPLAVVGPEKSSTAF